MKGIGAEDGFPIKNVGNDELKERDQVHANPPSLIFTGGTIKMMRN